MATETTTHTVPSPRYADSSLRLEIHVVDDLLCVSNEGRWCLHCATDFGHIECNAWAVFENGSTEIVETCLACLIPVLDATPYLDDTQTIIVEVKRGATLRPF